AEAIVEAAGTALPELVADRRHPEAAPNGRKRHLAAGVFAGERGVALVQRRATRDYPALVGRERRELTPERRAVEVARGFLGRDAGHRTGQADLAVELRPVEEEGRAQILGDLLPLLAFVVRVENESALVEPLEQDHAHRGRAVRGRRRDR